MIIKTADDQQPNLDALDALLGRPDVERATRRRIEAEIRSIRAGAKGERDAAYEIDFHYRDRKSYIVIHDLRLEVERMLRHWSDELEFFFARYGPDEHWPMTGALMDYKGGRACGFCGYKPTCPVGSRLER